VVQLIRAHDGYHLWSRTYEASTETLLRVESEIATSTAQALAPANGVVTQSPRLASTASPEAHDLYLRSKYYLAQRTPGALQTSLALAHQAIENDASFPLPYETVGTAEWVLGTLTVQSQKGSAERALAALDKALALDPRYGDAHALRAVILYTHDWDWPRADAEYELALQLGSTKVHGLYGWSLATRGRFPEAHRHLQIAQELDPLAAGPLQNRSAAYYMARDYRNARRELSRWLELDPKAFYGLLILGTVDILDDRCDSAQADFQKMADLYPELAGTQAYVALGNAKCGHPDEARRYLAHVQMNRPESDDQSRPEFYQLALVYGALHDADHVIQCLQQAADHRESQVLWLKIDPDFDEFRRIHAISS
jgi:Tfp pilus assembly protein PilF